jgi:hypothetical protein
MTAGKHWVEATTSRPFIYTIASLCLSSVAVCAPRTRQPVSGKQPPRTPAKSTLQSKKLSKPIELVLAGGERRTWMLENEGYGEGNQDENGEGLPDNRPDFKAGDRIKLPRNQDSWSVLTKVTLKLNGSGEGLWMLKYPRNFKMWRVVKNKTYKVRRGELSDVVKLPVTINLMIEGIEATDPDKPGTLNASFLPMATKKMVTDSVLVEVGKNGGFVSHSRRSVPRIQEEDTDTARVGESGG